MKLFQVISLEEVGVLTAEMPHSGFLCGKGLLAVGRQQVCRQPCASWQFPEAAPGLHLCRAAHCWPSLPGAPAAGAIWRYGVWRLPGHQTTTRLGSGSVCLAFYLFCPVCFQLPLWRSIPNKYLDCTLHLSAASGSPTCNSGLCPCLRSGSVAIGAENWLLQSLLQQSPGSQWHLELDLLPNPSSSQSELTLSSPAFLRGLAFEEFGLRPVAEADCHGVLRMNLKGSLAVSILYNK